MTQSEERTKIAQLKTLIESLAEKVALYESGKKNLKSKLANVTADSTQLKKLFDSTRT